MLVRKGQYGYYSPTGRFTRIVPCHGVDNVLPEARERLERRGLDLTPSILVLCVDPDADTGKADAKTGLRLEDLERHVQSIEPSATRNDAGDIELDDGATKVSLVRWEVDDELIAGVPVPQTLERLVCTAMVAAYPERGPAVQDWLSRRPKAPTSTPIPKAYAWSYMAGWHADQGCEAFFKLLWQDAKIAAELESRLRAGGAWRVAEALVH